MKHEPHRVSMWYRDTSSPSFKHPLFDLNTISFHTENFYGFTKHFTKDEFTMLNSLNEPKATFLY